MRGFAYDVVNAVLAAGADDVRDAIARAEALTAVRGSEDFAAVSAAFKRIKNILRQAEEKGFASGAAEDRQARRSEAIDLWDRSKELAPQIAKLREQRNYGEALALIATLRPDGGPVLRQGDGARSRRDGSRRQSRADRRSSAQFLDHRRFQRDRDGVGNQGFRSQPSALLALLCRPETHAPPGLPFPNRTRTRCVRSRNRGRRPWRRWPWQSPLPAVD